MRFPFFKRKSKDPFFTIAFYNLENLFDAEDNKKTLDRDFTPNGIKRWTVERYQQKREKLARTIVQIGPAEHKYPPVLIGIAEVERRSVLETLLHTDPLKTIPYNFVHYESPDERGIDTALIYHPKYFSVVASEALTLQVDNPNGARDTTRDILYVKGKLNNEMVHVFVNHWPSRRDGGELTAYKRLVAAKVVAAKMKAISVDELHPNFIVMGDFNDDPSSNAIKSLQQYSSLINPFETIHIPKNSGSSTYKKRWHLFDQILISHSFLNYTKATHSFSKAAIYNPSFLKEKSGKYKDSPYRTYARDHYIGGFSDHFPVYVLLKLHTS